MKQENPAVFVLSFAVIVFYVFQLPGVLPENASETTFQGRESHKTGLYKSHESGFPANYKSHKYEKLFRSHETKKNTYDRGALIRGNPRRRQVALIFSAHAYADGMQKVRAILHRFGVPGSFFLTGDLYRNPEYWELLRQLRQDGHYLGAHSDTHLCYVDWENGGGMTLSRQALYQDISNNYRAMAEFGIRPQEAPWFLPPYEMHNTLLSQWLSGIALTNINITPGGYTFLDYTVGANAYSSDQIFRLLQQQHRRKPQGLNGYILLLHISTSPARKDKFYARLDDLIYFLHSRGYAIVTLDELFG